MSFDFEAVKINLDSSAFEAEVKNLYKNPAISELKVKARLVKSSVTALINSFQTLKASVKVNALLGDLTQLEKSLAAFKGSVTVDAVLNFAKATSQLDTYDPKKTLYLKTALHKESLTLLKTEVRELLKPVFKTINLVLNQEKYQTTYSAIVASLADTKKLPRNVGVEINVEQTGVYLDALAEQLLAVSGEQTVEIKVDAEETKLTNFTLELSKLDSADKTVTLKIDTQDAELKTVINNLALLTGVTHKTKLKVDVDSTEIKALQTSIKNLQDNPETVNLKVDLDDTSISGVEAKLDDLTKDRTVVIKTEVQTGQASGAEALSEKLNDDTAKQVQKLFDKVNRGVKLADTDSAYSKETYGKHASELNEILSILDKIDNIDLFNEAVINISKVRDILTSDKVKGEFNYKIPQLKQKKQVSSQPVELSAKLVIDAGSLKATVDHIESESATISVKTEADLTSLKAVTDKIEGKTPTVTVKADLDQPSVVETISKIEQQSAQLPVKTDPDMESVQQTISVIEATKEATIPLKVELDQTSVETETQKAEANAEISVEAIVDESKLDSFKADLTQLKADSHTVEISVELDPGSLLESTNQLAELSKDRTATIKTVVDDSQTKESNEPSRLLAKDESYQVNKLFQKADKGIKQDEFGAAYKASTYSQHAEELKEILVLLDKIDDVDLFNEAVTKISKVRDILAKMPGTEFNHEIPALKQKKQNKTEGIGSAFKDVTVDIPVKAKLDEGSIQNAIAQIETAGASINLKVATDGTDISAIIADIGTKKANLPLQIDLAPEILTATLVSLETAVKSKLDELQIYIANKLEAGFDQGISSIKTAQNPTVDLEVRMIGLDGVTQMLSSLKELGDFGVLQVNTELDTLIKKSQTIADWIKAAQAYNITLALQFNDFADDEVKAQVTEVQTILDKFPVYLAIALAEDAKTVINSAIAKLSLDEKKIDLGVDCQELHKAVDDCIKRVEQNLVNLSVTLNSGLIKNQVSKILAYLRSQKAQINLHLNSGAIASQLAVVIQDIEASEALLALALNDSRFQSQLADLKDKIANDFVNLQVEIANLDASDAAEGVGKQIKDEVVAAVKQISAEDLQAYKNKNSQAKTSITKVGKGTNVKDETITSQRDALLDITKALEGSEETVMLSAINESIEKLSTILKARGHEDLNTMGGASAELSKNPYRSPAVQARLERALAQREAAAAKPIEKPQDNGAKITAADFLEGAGEEKEGSIVELAKGIAKILAEVKGLGDVWDDSKLPRLFGKGSPLQPKARGLATNDSSAIVLAGTVADDLRDIKNIGRDALITLTHEINHIMQNLADNLGRDFNYETEAQNPEESRKVQGVLGSKDYQDLNSKDGGKTFKREIDSNLVPLRHLDEITSKLGLTVKDTDTTLQKYAKSLRNSAIAMRQSAVVAENMAKFNNDSNGRKLFKKMLTAYMEFVDDLEAQKLPPNIIQQLVTEATGSAEYFNPLGDASAEMSSDPNKVQELDKLDIPQLQAKIQTLVREINSLNTQLKGTKKGSAERAQLQSKKDLVVGEKLLIAEALKSKLALQDPALKGVQVKKQVIEQRKAPEIEGAQVEAINAKTVLIQTTQLGVQQRDQDASALTQSKTKKTDSQTVAIEANTVRKDNAADSKLETDQLNRDIKDRIAAQKRATQKQLDIAKIKKEQYAAELGRLRSIKQSETNKLAVPKAIAELELKRQRNALLLTQLEKSKLDLHVALNTADTRIQREIVKTSGAILKNLKLEEQITGVRQKNARAEAGTASGANKSSSKSSSSGAATTQPLPPSQILPPAPRKAPDAELQAARAQALSEFKNTSNAVGASAASPAKTSNDLKVQRQLYQTKLLELKTQRRALQNVIANAVSVDEIERSQLSVERAELQVMKAHFAVKNAELTSIRKQQIIDSSNAKEARRVAKENEKNTAKSSRDGTVGAKSQANAERKLPINLGLNILEASNNRLGNFARIFVDIAEGIHGASMAGETFGKTLNRVKMPIAIIATIGAFSSLAAITAPAALAVQKLEKSLAAFGNQDQFAGAFKTAQSLALDYGVSLSTAAGELARFKTSLVDTSIEGEGDSIFSSLGRYGSIVGATQDELSRGYVALGQIASKGKVSLEELNSQLSEAIPGSSSMAAKALGITKKELYELAATGSLLSDDFLPKFRDELEKVAEAQEAIGSETLSVAFSRVKESLVQLGLEQTQQGLNLLAGGLSKVADVLKTGLQDPLDGVENKFTSFSNILNKSVIAGLVFLGNTLVRFLAPKLILAGTNLALLTNGLYRNARGLRASSAASEMAIMNFKNLTTAFRSAMLSLAPMLVAFALLDTAFKVLDQANGGEIFNSLTEGMKETADNVGKLKDKILKDFEEIENGKPNLDKDPKNDFLGNIDAPNVSMVDRQKIADEYYNKSGAERFLARQGANLEVSKNAFRKGKDKVNYSQELTTAYDLNDQQTIEKEIVKANFEISKSSQKVSADLGAVNDQLGAFVNDAKAMAELGAQVAERNSLDETIAGMGLLIKSFNEGSVSSAQLKGLLTELKVPNDLIPPELGTGIGGAAKEADDLAVILGQLKFKQGELNTEINKLSPETFKLQIKTAQDAQKTLPKTSEEYKTQSKVILEASINLEKYNQIVGQQKVQLDFVNKALMAYNTLKAEQEGKVDQAALLSKVLLKEEALNKGLIKRGSIENQLTRIQAKSHTEKMKGYKAQRIALNSLTAKVNKSDAFQAKQLINPALFSKQKDGTFSFKVDRASIAELDLLLNSPVANFTDSFKKALETAKTEMSGLDSGYLSELDAFQDIEFSVREKFAEIDKETTENLNDINKEIKDKTKDFITSLKESLDAINEEIKGLEKELKNLKVTNAGKELTNSLEEFVNSVDTPLDEGILDNIRLRIQQGVDNTLADIEFESETDRIETAFNDGVDNIRKAFDDYLVEFQKLQQDLIKARLEKAKADREKAEAQAALKNDDSLQPNLKVFDLSRSELSQGIGQSVVNNPDLDSEALLKVDREIGEESKKQTEQNNAQLASQDRANVLAAAQIDSTDASASDIVDALQNQSISVDNDFTNLTVFESQLKVLLQIRDTLTAAGLGGVLALEGEGAGITQEPGEVRRARAASNELKAAYEERDSAIARMNEAQDAFQKDNTDLESAKNFELAADAIQKTELAIMNLERELGNFGHKIDNPLLVEDQTKLGSITPNQRVVQNKYGTGILSNINREATRRAQENAPIDPKKLEERQEKGNNRAGATKAEIRQILKKTSYTEQELINLPRNEVEYIAELLKMTLVPLEKMAVAPIYEDGSQAKPEQKGTPSQVKELADRLNQRRGANLTQEGDPASSVGNQQQLNQTIVSQESLTDSVQSLEQTMINPAISGNSALTSLGTATRQSEEKKRDISKKIRDESRREKELNSKSINNQVVANNKEAVKLPGEKAITEALKPKEDPYRRQAIDNLKDEFTQLDALTDATKEAEEKITTLKTTVAALKEPASDLFTEVSDDAIKAGLDPAAIIAEQIASANSNIAELEGNDQLTAARTLLKTEEARLAILRQDEEVLLRMTGEYNKQVKTSGLSQKQERTKFILEDPNINPEDAVKAKRLEMKNEQQITFGDRKEKLARDFHAADPLLSLVEAAKQAEEQLRMLDSVELKNLEASLDTVVNKLKGSFKETMVGILDIDFTDSSKSLSDKIFGVFSGILRNLQSWAANKLGDVLMSALNPGSSDKAGNFLNPQQSQGKGAAGTAAQIGMSALGSFGGTYGQIGAMALSALFADGGEVGKSIGAESAIAQMMQKERIMSNGKQPVLAALHMNEQVLSTKNKDAQAFRAFQSAGIWDAMKESNGFASGGTVGRSFPASSMLMNKTSNSQTKTITSINNFNFTATNDKLINRTEKQIKNRKDQFLD